MAMELGSNSEQHLTPVIFRTDGCSSYSIIFGKIHLRIISSNFFYASILIIPAVIPFQLLIDVTIHPKTTCGLFLDDPFEIRDEMILWDFSSCLKLRCCESKTSVHEIINWRVTVNVWKWVLKYIERVQERLYRCIKYSISTRHLSNPLYKLFLDFRKSRTKTNQINEKIRLHRCWWQIWDTCWPIRVDVDWFVTLKNSPTKQFCHQYLKTVTMIK